MRSLSCCTVSTSCFLRLTRSLRFAMSWSFESTSALSERIFSCDLDTSDCSFATSSSLSMFTRRSRASSSLILSALVNRAYSSPVT